MAISGGDGSIILTTKVDTSGISKGSLSIRSALQGVDNTVKKVQNSFSAFREQKVTLAMLNQAIKDQQYVLNSLNLEYAEYVARGKASSTEAKQLKSNIDALTVEMREMEGAAATLGAKGSASINKIGLAMKSLLVYFIGIQTIFKVINFSGEAAQFATQTEASVQRLVDIYGEASQVVGDFIDQNARAIGLSRASAASFASSYGNIFSAFSDQRTNAELTNEFLNLTAVIASKTGRTLEETQEKIKSGLFGNLRAIDDLGIFVRQTALESSEAFRKLAGDRSWEELSSQEQQQIRAYAIMEQGVQKYGNTVMETTALTRSQYQAAYEDFQNTWGQVVNTVLIPVLKVLTQVFTIATKGLQVMAGLTGKTVDNSKIQENSIGGAVDNQKELTKEIEKTNKAQKKSLAAFDEINILSQETAKNASNTDGAGASNVGIGGVGGNYDNSFVDKIDADLAAIMGYVGFALAAIGIILICFGRIGWGIGFLIAGAAIFSVSQAALSEGAELEKVKNIMNGIIAGVSLLALILGIILVCTTKNPKALALGIGLIVVGAAGLATEIALNWNAIKENVQKFFVENGALIAGISLGLLVIGVLLCFAHQWGLGIGLIAAGAVGLAATVSINWNAIVDNIKKFVFENPELIALISGGLLILGIILCFVNLVLGISLIAIGAVGLVTIATLNWNAIVDNIKKFVFENSTLLALISGGLLILGILICFVNLPLGIALIAAGATGLVTITALNWDAIVNWVKGAWDAVKQFWNTYIAPIFTAKWWADLGKRAINGLLGVIEKGLNWIIEKINSFIDGLSGMVTAVGDVIGVDWSIPKIPKVKIPRLAQGAVIPPNREFLAVLGDQKRGTNIEAPLDTIVEAMNIALQNNGSGQTTKEEHYYLGETELMSIIYKLVKGGERLQGNSLISSGGVY